jgi:HAD superfamily hydrolase (TIGR01509 family)
MDFKAIILDLDGTILDNDVVYTSSFRKVLAEAGGKTFKEPLPLRGSIGVKPNWLILIEKYHLMGKNVDELTRRTQDEYLRNLDKVVVREGFVEFAGRLKKDGVKFALATSNEKEVADVCLERFGLRGIFEAVVVLEDVKKLKPAPDLFLEAARRLSVFPIDCLVVEDAPVGIEAAHAAGMRVACLVYENDEQEKKEADLIFRGFFELEGKIHQFSLI